MEYSKGKLYLTWNRNGYNLIGWMTISFIVILLVQSLNLCDGTFRT